MASNFYHSLENNFLWLLTDCHDGSLGFCREEGAMQLLREPYSTKNEKCGRINESGETGVVLSEPQRDVFTETALVGFTCPARVVLTEPEWVRFAK